MANNKDYYETLGVSKNATKDEIKSAYRKLAMKYHPDRNKEPGAEKKFMEIQEAYDILKDDEKRKTYDQFGSAAFEQGGFGANGANPFSQGFGFSGFDDLFSQFMGGGRTNRSTQNRTYNGDDVLFTKTISFMDAINGTKAKVPYSYEKTCSSCHGNGAKNGNDFSTCPHCNGSGVLKTQARTVFGVFESNQTCNFCNGTGKIIKNKCPDCNGNGFNKVREDLNIEIPAGINSGQQIRVSQKGGRGVNGGHNGDLYIEIKVSPHQFFKRDGNDIHLVVPIDFIDAALGTTINVPTVYKDSLSLKVPEGVQPGTVLKMRGCGVKHFKTGIPGDQYVHLDIKTPTKINKNQKELLQKLKLYDNNFYYDKFTKSFKK